MTDPTLRASDADRDRTVAALQRHTVAGRLSLDEFSDRVGAAYRAATVADLVAVIHDLPALPPEAPAAPARSPGAQHHQLAIAFLVAIVALVLLGTLLALTR
jgi:hypothetical protein